MRKASKLETPQGGTAFRFQNDKTAEEKNAVAESGSDQAYSGGAIHFGPVNKGAALETEETDQAESAVKGMDQQKVENHAQNKYPWDGIIANTWSAALRGTPGKSVFIANVPKGTGVTVIGNTGNWLHVQVNINGVQKTGYISQELVILSKASKVADEMKSMVGSEATWTPSGNNGTNTFAKWAKAEKETEAPRINRYTTINCWEMVLLAAYRINAIDWKWIHDLYLNNEGNWAVELPSRLTSTPQMPYDLVKKTPVPRKGELVFFDGANHVALATGNGDSVYTFWPPPDKKSYSYTVDKVKVSTISALATYMGKSTKVTIGKAIW